MDYGKLAAMKKAREKKLKSEEIKDTSVKKKTKKKEPAIDLEPLKAKRARVITEYKYDWNDKTTSENSKYLCEEFENGHRAKILVLPPGVGKTAIAVKTIAELQKARGRKVPFLVLASRTIVDGRGWHNTILTWNHDNPDCQIEPMMIETFDRFSTMLEFPKLVTQICMHLADDGIIVIDEVQNYKNQTSKRSKKLQKLSMFKKLGLSATPLTNDVVMDGGSYLIMNDDFSNKTQFMRETGLDMKVGGRFNELMIYDKSGHISPVLWEYYPTFLEKLSNVIYRPDVDLQNLDMPDVETKMHSLQFNDVLHEDMKSLAKAYQKRMFDSAIDYRMAIIERINADEDRLNEMIEIVKDENTVQPLIFYTHNAVKEAIIDRLTEEKIEYQLVSGGNSFGDVDLDKDCPILIQYQSGSEGIEMKKSNTSIFYENQTSYRVLEQARGRNRRRGMKHEIKHHHLVSPVMFDLELFQRVNKREEISNATLDEITEMTLEILKG